MHANLILVGDIVYLLCVAAAIGIVYYTMNRRIECLHWRVVTLKSRADDLEAALGQTRALLQVPPLPLTRYLEGASPQ